MGNYEKIITIDIHNKPTFQIDGFEVGWIDQLLIKTGLIPIKELSVDIFHDDKIIGRLRAFQRHTSIYLNFSLFLVEKNSQSRRYTARNNHGFN